MKKRRKHGRTFSRIRSSGSIPFSDLSESKLRPAVILAEISRDDFVCCQVTSNPYADPNAVELAEEDFTEGSLKRASYTRPGKLFTANLQPFERVAGALKEEPRTEIVEQLVRLLRSESW